MTTIRMSKVYDPKVFGNEIAWCLTWQTWRMRAPAFWYFRDRRKALAVRGTFARSDYQTLTLRKASVPPTTPFLDHA